MLETAIIGGGPCGLALARSLRRQGRPVALFEARDRLGGRVLTVQGGAGLAMDLGPTWFWPQTQPLVAALMAELNLADLPQHDQGAVLHLRDPDKTPDLLADQSVHGGARRLEGGMGRLVEALAESLPPESLHLGHVLAAVRDCGTHVDLTFAVGDRQVTHEARHVVLALPPRLVEEHIRFAPGLDDALRDAMRDARTWMAAEAKVVIGYPAASWRAAGLSGNAFVTHEQAVVAEIFDACDGAGAKAALGGFLALKPDLRENFNIGMPMLLDNQMTQLFGSAVEHGEQHYRDWAAEPFTCSARDRAEPAAEHVDMGNPLLRRALWDGKLHLGGAETASRGAGYIEGALEAARRLDRALQRARTGADAGAAPGLPAAAHGAGLNAASQARFAAWVAGQNDAALDDYRRRLVASLAAQDREQLTQRAVLAAVEQVFDQALAVLDDLPFDTGAVAVERGRSALMPGIQQPFGAFLQAIMDDVAAFNRTSCALSNFPDEHRLPQDYHQAILRDIAAAWQDFSLAANRMLLAKGDPAQGALSRNRADQPATHLPL